MLGSHIHVKMLTPKRPKDLQVKSTFLHPRQLARPRSGYSHQVLCAPQQWWRRTLCVDMCGHVWTYACFFFPLLCGNSLQTLWPLYGVCQRPTLGMLPPRGRGVVYFPPRGRGVVYFPARCCPLAEP